MSVTELKYNILRTHSIGLTTDWMQQKLALVNRKAGLLNIYIQKEAKRESKQTKNRTEYAKDTVGYDIKV